MNIQQFLEEHNEVSCACGTYVNVEDHNTRLINFVLSEVEREVYRKLTSLSTTKIDYLDKVVLQNTRDELSTIINNLRVK